MSDGPNARALLAPLLIWHC